MTALWLAHLLVPHLSVVPRTALCQVGAVKLHLGHLFYCLRWVRA